MTTPKKIIIQDLELADEEIARLRKENKELKQKLEEFAKELIQHHEEYVNIIEMVFELEKENKELKEKLEKLRIDNIYEEWLYE